VPRTPALGDAAQIRELLRNWPRLPTPLSAHKLLGSRRRGVGPALTSRQHQHY